MEVSIQSISGLTELFPGPVDVDYRCDLLSRFVGSGGFLNQLLVCHWFACHWFARAEVDQDLNKCLSKKNILVADGEYCKTHNTWVWHGIQDNWTNMRIRQSHQFRSSASQSWDEGVEALTPENHRWVWWPTSLSYWTRRIPVPHGRWVPMVCGDVSKPCIPGENQIVGTVNWYSSPKKTLQIWNDLTCCDAIPMHQMSLKLVRVLAYCLPICLHCQSHWLS